ncbi:MAG TPA: hypothetical protein DEA08_01440 [Planctomycetes bacterium]|nr:hypothetical protein [Planctomycetota bacterium]
MSQIDPQLAPGEGAAPGPEKKQKRKRSLKRRLAFAAFYLVFLVILLEVGAFVANRVIASRAGRASLDHTAVIPSAWLGHELNDVYGKVSKIPELNTHNAQGFKYPKDLSAEKPATVIRIFALGGSTLYGWGSKHLQGYPIRRLHLNNEETITHFLEKKLEERFADSGFDFEVVNGGIPDYSSQHHLIRLNKDVYRFDPDMVLLVVGANEFYTLENYNPLVHYNAGGKAVLHSFHQRSFWFTMWIGARYMAQYSSTFNTLQYGALNKWQAQEKGKVFEIEPRQNPETLDGVEERFKERARRTFLWTYHQIAAATSYRGTPTAVFLQPQIVFEEPSLMGPRDQETLKIVKSQMGTAETTPRMVAFMRKVKELLPGLFDEIKMTYYDKATLTAGLQTASQEDYFLDYTHLTPEGSAKFADHMFECLLPSVEALVAKRKAAQEKG